MECKLENRQDLITGYLSGDLSEGEEKAFEEHFFQCDECFRELKIAESAIEIIKHEGSGTLNVKPKTINKFNGSVKRIPFYNKSGWGIAFAAVLIIAVVLLLRLPADKLPGSNNKADAVTADSIKNEPQRLSGAEKNDESAAAEQKDKGREDIAANFTGKDFKPDPYMEEWSTENVRSGSEKLYAVLSPSESQKIYNKDVIFSWKMAAGEPVTIKVLTNEEKVVFSSTPDNTPTIAVRVTPGNFEHSGLYYWKIEDENEVLYVGKFYFIKQEHSLRDSL